MSVPYKSKPARVIEKVRKIWKKPPGGGSVTFGSGGTGHGGTTSPIGSDGEVVYKKPPPRKGRPD